MLDERGALGAGYTENFRAVVGDPHGSCCLSMSLSTPCDFSLASICAFNGLRQHDHSSTCQPARRRSSHSSNVKSLSRTKRPTDLRNQQALFLTPLFYTKDSRYVDRGYLEGDTPLDKASIEGSLSPLSGASSQQIRLSG